MYLSKLGSNNQQVTLLSLLFVLVICSQFAISFFQDRREKRNELDLRLVKAAQLTDRFISGKHYHSNLHDESVSETDEFDMAMKLSLLAKELDLAYIYTMKLVDGEIKFISSSLTPEELAGGAYSPVYWRTYNDADSAIRRAADSKEPTYASYTDQWGDFRSVFVAKQAGDKSHYIIGVDVSKSALDQISYASALDALKRSILFFALCAPFVFYSVRVTRAAYLRRREDLLKDALTGLQNKHALLEDIPNFERPSLLILNIDRFREVSHAYSFETGDAVLSAFAYNLFNYTHLKIKAKKVYRLYADEFAVLTDLNCTQQERLAIFKDFYKAVVTQKYRMPDEKCVSFRVTVGTSDGPSAMLFEEAQIALRVARETNTTVVPFQNTEGMPEHYLKNIECREQVKRALYEDRLVPYFHPIVSTASGKIAKYEVLARMVDQQRKVVMMPEEFIPVLKCLRLYHQFSLSLLSHAIDLASREKIDVSFNISTKDISEAGAFQSMVAMVKASGIASRVHFELLESDSLVSTAILVEAIDALKALGCRVGLDDLGKDYSNFDRLTSLPIDFVKLDRSVMPNISSSQQAASIAGSVIGFARGKQIATVAEFCNSRELCVAAKDMGIEYIQGFYLAEPSPNIVRDVCVF